MKKNKIGVIGGLGHIGLIQAACLAQIGYETIAYDLNVKKMENILVGRMPFYEPHLEEMVKENLNKRLLKFTSEIKDLENAEIVFICVGTPSLPSGEADLSQVYKAVKQVAEISKNHCLAVMKSTVPVGTSRGLTAYLEKNGLQEKVTMVSNPEFLREGSGVKDFWEPARIVVGSEVVEASEKVAKLYQPRGVPIILTSWENAELIKYASNTFLATKISFINEIALLSEKVGGDIKIISKGMGLDPRVNPYFIEAGVGFSGPCLEKDLKAFINQFRKQEVKPRLLNSVLEINEGQRRNLVKKLEEQLGTLKGKEIGVLGMAFKAETDDVRESHSLPIVKDLLRRGARVTVTDSWVKKPEEGGISPTELVGVRWVASPYEVAQDKDGILILTAWQEYQNLDLDKLKNSMKNPLIVDGRNLFDPEEMKSLDINYWGVGR